MKSKKTNLGKTINSLWNFWSPVIFTFSLYFGIRNFLFEARYIPSGSMLPGLQVKDRLIIEKITLKRRLPRRGEIVVFNSPFSFDNILNKKSVISPLQCSIVNLPIISSLVGVSDPTCDAYIKRVVAIAGDEVLINNKGQVIINGGVQSEAYGVNYCFSSTKETALCPAWIGNVPDGHVFVLGDNRKNSWDGRYWPGGGFLPVKEILGRAVWRFWPINRIGTLSLKTATNYFA